MFPKDFWWGSASSATQMEGFSGADGKGKNIWDYWYETEPLPLKTSSFYLIQMTPGSLQEIRFYII